jgi:hypothetical protein
MGQSLGMISHWDVLVVEGPMVFSKQTSPHNQQVPRGGALDTSWPQIPVAHLSFETDTNFSTIHCLSA